LKKLTRKNVGKISRKEVVVIMDYISLTPTRFWVTWTPNTRQRELLLDAPSSPDSMFEIGMEMTVRLFEDEDPHNLPIRIQSVLRQAFIESIKAERLKPESEWDIPLIVHSCNEYAIGLSRSELERRRFDYYFAGGEWKFEPVEKKKNRKRQSA